MTTQLEPDAATATTGSHTPYPLKDPTKVAPQRYTSREFAAWERDKLWRHCWQVACREEEIPRAGDFTEYEIAGQSILLVRQNDGSVKAFFNACRHRATALGVGTGEFPGGQIVCPYHGWRWNLDGENTHVYASKGFRPDCLKPDFLRLRECRTHSAMGLVWVNLDPNGPEFADTVGHAERAFAPVGLDRMRTRWWRYTVIPANWKIAQEAFMEAYHVGQAHPSLSMGSTDEDFDTDDDEGYEILPGGNAHMVHATLPIPTGMTQAEYFTRYNWAMYHGTGAYPTEREMFVQSGLQERKIPDEQFIGAFFQELYNYAEGAGIPLPPPTTDTVGFGHIFPNITVLSQYGNALMYRSRPNGDDPESCIFEVWALQIPSVDDQPGRPTREGPIPLDEWPTILREDFSNIVGQQKGLRTDGMDELTLSERYEPMIINNHQEIDRYLARY